MRTATRRASLTVSLTLLSAIAASLPAGAEAPPEPSRPALRGFTFDLGVGGAQPVLHVRQGGGGRDDIVGTLTRRGSYGVVLSAISPGWILWRPRENVAVGLDLRYSLRFGFTIDRQEADGESFKDLGTSADGHMMYLLPVLFLMTADPAKPPPERSEVKVGLGVGLSHTRLTGDIILTELPDRPRREFSFDESGLGFGGFVEWRRGMLFCRMGVAGQELDDGDLTFAPRAITLEAGITVR